MQIENINLRQKLAILTDGQMVNITNFLDIDGDETTDLEEVTAVVAGPDNCGKWYTDLLDSFTTSRPN